ncbi:DUF1919 domain-containing protein [Siansivirga zeaxanthinifaciens]|uniref:Acetyltransferase n=1 Tax=Siansivirga zeaxanthinifaciens CC-SAMT-1 TaxID=1454006 RepID=A0A0C5WNX4_9FLAO|nr:DUF1919 domain-containing protein [Siansivirga zeaxanthinifaciens]AJR04620.1 acetyltransferase [Siansivirga zeaxanthinifaciens CC-SAMT-1]
MKMFRKLYVLISRKFRKQFNEHFRAKDIEILKDKEFLIISNNCWGGSVYQWYKRPYNTPFVGLFIYSSCYLKMLRNFEYYMGQTLTFISESKYPSTGKSYPIGLLKDIEIHFEHYKNEDEAREKWERRTKRMLEVNNIDNFFLKICDRELISKSDLIEFHKLPFKNKISFSINDYDELKKCNHIKILECDKKRACVPNGKKLYELTYLYYDLNKWLVN